MTDEISNVIFHNRASKMTTEFSNVIFQSWANTMTAEFSNVVLHSRPNKMTAEFSNVALQIRPSKMTAAFSNAIFFTMNKGKWRRQFWRSFLTHNQAKIRLPEVKISYFIPSDIKDLNILQTTDWGQLGM